MGCGFRLLVGGLPRTAIYCRVSGNRPGRRHGSDRRIPGVDLWSLKARKELRVLDPQDRQHQSRRQSHYDWCACFSPDGRTLAVSCGDERIRLYDWHAGALLREILCGKESFRCLVFSPTGQTLAGCGESPVHLWETSTGALIRKFQNSDKDGANCVAFSPDGRRLAVATNGPIDVWDVYTGEELSARNGKPLLAGGHKGDFLSVAFSPDGKTIASGMPIPRSFSGRP